MIRVFEVTCQNCCRKNPIEYPMDEQIKFNCVCGAAFSGVRHADGLGLDGEWTASRWQWKLVAVVALFTAMGLAAGFLIGFICGHH